MGGVSGNGGRLHAMASWKLMKDVESQQDQLDDKYAGTEFQNSKRMDSGEWMRKAWW